MHFVPRDKTILKTKLQFNWVNRMKMNEEAY